MGKQIEDIPFFSLIDRNEAFRPQLRSAIDDVIGSGNLIGGPFVEGFESDFGRYLGAAKVVGVGNGLDAIRLGLQALGVNPGDEIIVPALTFVATHLAVVQVGAIPISVDVNPLTAQISVDGVRAAITPKTVGIIAVHLYGRAAPIIELRSIADQYGLALVEDAAQAHGLRPCGAPVGAYSDFAAFSFYPTKNLGALGDAGAVVTHNAALAEQVRSYANYGRSRKSKYHHSIPGWNSRLDPIQATVLSLFLPHLDAWNSRRTEIANEYLETLSEKCRPSIESITAKLSSYSVWHHFVVKTEDRESFRSNWSKNGIGTEVHYPELPATVVEPLIQPDEIRERYPNSATLSSQITSLPMHPWLKAESVERICETLSASNCESLG